MLIEIYIELCVFMLYTCTESLPTSCECWRDIWEGTVTVFNIVPHHKIITFDIFEEFQSFLRWGTLFTEGGQYSLVNNVPRVIIHGGTVFTPTPAALETWQLTAWAVMWPNRLRKRILVYTAQGSQVGLTARQLECKAPLIMTQAPYTSC